MGLFFLFGILYVSYGIFFLTALIRTIRKGGKGKLDAVSEILMLLAEVLFTIIGPVIGFLRYDEYGPEIPFAKQHVLTVILFVMVSSMSFWIARFTSKSANPMLRIVVSVGLLQGIVLCIVTSIHFLAFIPLGIIYPIMGFELLSPIFAVFLLAREFYFYTKIEINYDDALPYREELGFIPLPFRILRAPFVPRLVIYGGLLIILVIVQMLFAYGCGQDIDSIVKAFTHSVGFIFSR